MKNDKNEVRRNLKRKVFELYAQAIKDMDMGVPTADTRDWKETLEMIIPHEILYNPHTTALFTTYFASQHQFDNDNCLNGIVYWLIQESTDLLRAAVILTFYMSITEDTKNANPISYNPIQFLGELEKYIKNAKDDWRAAQAKQTQLGFRQNF